LVRVGRAGVLEAQGGAEAWAAALRGRRGIEPTMLPIGSPFRRRPERQGGKASEDPSGVVAFFVPDACGCAATRRCA
jgi:hypothetical protein